ncbi:MAG: 3-hydroxyacyl-ACP dehydratase FabZ family protein [Polyangiaceae bacterium]
MRYILLDRITFVQPGELARGIKCVSLTDEILHDHFPDHPLLPGVLSIEAAAQLAGFLLEISSPETTDPPKRSLLVQIDKAKFHRPARPGDTLELFAQLKQGMDGAARVDVGADIAGEKSMRGSLTFMLREIPSERVHAQRRYLYELWTRDLDLKVKIR